jgi:hypothetical protein
MNTTDLLVEYLVLGAMADIWLFCLLFFLFPTEVSKLPQLVQSIDKIIPILAILFLALTYTIGGIVNFVADSLFSPVHRRFRKKLFNKSGTEYDVATGFINQFAAPQTIARLQYHGHIIRLSRGNMLNFGFLSVVLLLSGNLQDSRFLIWFGISLLLSVLSFFQWRERFQSTYKEMLSAYTVIFSELGKNKDKKVEKKKTANS